MELCRERSGTGKEKDEEEEFCRERLGTGKEEEEEELCRGKCFLA